MMNAHNQPGPVHFPCAASELPSLCGRVLGSLAIALASAGAAAAPGTLDPGWGTGGVAQFATGLTYSHGLVAMRTSAGKYVVLSRAARNTAYARSGAVVMRLNANGTVDDTYHSWGGSMLFTRWFSSQPTLDELPGDEAILSGLGRAGSTSGFVIGKLGPNGERDYGFGTLGRFVHVPGGVQAKSGNAVRQADGKYVFGGVAVVGGVNKPVLVRVNANGTLDATFGVNGEVLGATLPETNAVARFLKAPDGKFVLAGNGLDGSTFRTMAHRFNADGSLDTSFGAGTGRTSIDWGLGESYSAVYGAAMDASGRLVTVSLICVDGPCTVRRYGYARLDTAGALDATFGTGGKVVATYDTATPEVGTPHEVAIQADGAIVVAGGVQTANNRDFAVIRLTASGALDTSFNGTGIFTIDTAGAFDFAWTPIVEPDGRIFVVGGSESATESRTMALRLNANGTPDTSFGSGGVAFASPAAWGYSEYYSQVVLPDGGVIVGGLESFGGTDMVLAKFTPTGARDDSFGVAGVVHHEIDNDSTDQFFVLLRQDDGKLVAGGLHGIAGGGYEYQDANAAVVRFNADGTLDTTFGAGGLVSIDIGTATNDIIRGGLIQPDGKLVFAGQTTAGPNPMNTFVLRLNPDGSRDAGFGANGIVVLDQGVNIVDRGRGVSYQPGDGKLLVVGSHGSASSTDFGVVRLNADGSVDTGFGTGGLVTIDFGGITEYAYKAVAHNNQIFVVGITDEGGLRGGAIAALLSDGALDTTFGVSGGKMVLRMGGGPLVASDLRDIVVRQARLYLAGWTGTFPATDFFVVRLHTNGVLDGVFAPAGMRSVDAGDWDQGTTGLHISPGGKLTVSGYSSRNGTQGVAAIRINVESETSTSLVSSQPSSYLGQPVTFTATVSAASGVAPGTGSIRFRANGVTIPGCEAVPVVAGVAPCTTSGLAIGSLSITATYLFVMGADFLDSTSPAVTQVVGLDPALDQDGDGIPNGVEVSEGTDPLAKDNDIFVGGNLGARLFAMQMYRDFLGREGDAAGISGWASAVSSGAWSRLQVIDAFLNSAEFAGFVAPVVRLYFATFLRVPDYAGLNFNAGLVRAGTVTPVQLADFFTASPEFLATYGSLDNTQFVTLLYNNVLGRAPDAAGLSGWVALLEGGMTRGQVLYGFSESAEYQAAMANEVFVTMMYAGMLRRTPEPVGFNGWVGYLDAGTFTREQVINGFFLSTEYRARFLP